MICPNCGNPTAYIRRRSMAFGKGAELLVLENVPVITCRECAIESLSITTLGQIEQLQANLDAVPLSSVHRTFFQDEQDPVLDRLTEAVAVA